jgi:hypothetical protein
VVLALSSLALLSCSNESADRMALARRFGFAHCVVAQLARLKPLPRETARAIFEQDDSVDLALFAAHTDESFSTTDLEGTLEACSQKAERVRFVIPSGRLKPELVADIPGCQRKDGACVIDWTVGTEATLPPEFSRLLALLAPQSDASPERPLTFLVRSSQAIEGAVLDFRTSAPRARSATCRKTGTRPLPGNALWNGAIDPCLTVTTNADGKATFFYVPPLTGLKVRITLPGEKPERIERYFDFRGAAPTELALDPTREGAGWDRPPPAMPGCGTPELLAPVVSKAEKMIPGLRRALGAASVVVDDTGRLREPQGVTPATWTTLRHYRVAAPPSCKPVRIGLDVVGEG